MPVVSPFSFHFYFVIGLLLWNFIFIFASERNSYGYIASFKYSGFNLRRSLGTFQESAQSRSQGFREKTKVGRDLRRIKGGCRQAYQGSEERKGKDLFLRLLGERKKMA